MPLPVGKVSQCAPRTPFWQIAPNRNPLLSALRRASAQAISGRKAARNAPACQARKSPVP